MDASTPEAKDHLERVNEWVDAKAAQHADRVASHFGISRERAHTLLKSTIRAIAGEAVKRGGAATGTLRDKSGKKLSLRVGEKQAQAQPAQSRPTPPPIPKTPPPLPGPTSGAVPRPANPAAEGSLPPQAPKPSLWNRLKNSRAGRTVAKLDDAYRDVIDRGTIVAGNDDERAEARKRRKLRAVGKAVVDTRYAELLEAYGDTSARAVLEAAAELAEGTDAAVVLKSWNESAHPRDHGKFAHAAGARGGREEIGSGNTGTVYREGDEAVKSARHPDGRETREGEFYDQLRGVVGVAPGRREGDEIRTPHYQEVLSVDEVPDPAARESMGSEVGRNKNRLLNAANAMGEAGIDYNDPLQVGFDDDYTAHVIDFSNAGKVEPGVALRANIERVARFLSDFGAKHTADSVLRAFGVYNFAKGLSGGSKESAVKRVAALAEKGNRTAMHVQSIGPEKVAGYDVNHVYYATNPRPVLRDVLQSEPDADGVKVILSAEPLDADTIRQYNLTPVVHPAERTAPSSGKPAA